ncbi:MAG: response regulator [Chloroflexi bacterium]|nr:response regulator [Chloroflexota bacterium]MBU1747024.1 response regulator [Chloroflexota bacterium]MBU1877454.1 response regulator [Chloroflexota bacterium]
MSAIRILVIDDESLTRISLADFLQDMDYETATASSGEAAIHLQEERPFDVCIVDIRMPGMDGIETIQHLHRIAPQSQFIICTGSPQFALSPMLSEIGLSEDDIVRKPVLDMNVFLMLITQMMPGEVVHE